MRNLSQQKAACIAHTAHLTEHSWLISTDWTRLPVVERVGHSQLVALPSCRRHLVHHFVLPLGCKDRMLALGLTWWLMKMAEGWFEDGDKGERVLRVAPGDSSLEGVGAVVRLSDECR